MLGLNLTSKILPFGGSDHRPILLEMKNPKNLGPIPFRFSSLWANHPEFLNLVSKAWAPPVTGSPFFVWEEKLRRLKKALKDWAKSLIPPGQAKFLAAHALEMHQTKIEGGTVDYNDLQLETKLHSDLHNACWQESEWWRKKARCKWLKNGDRNTSYFHKHAMARKNFNYVTEIQIQDILITNFEEIKIATTNHF